MSKHEDTLVGIELEALETKNITQVFSLMGELHQYQTEYFEQDGVEVYAPELNLEDFDVHIIKAQTIYVDHHVPVGVVLTRPSNCFRDTCSISDIIIQKNARNHGIGRMALTQIMEELKEQGYKHVSLNVNARNEYALKLYEELGFTERSLFMMKEL